MPNYPASQTSQSSATQANKTKKSNTTLIAVIIIIIAIVGILALIGSTLLSPTQVLAPTSNATPVYMSIPQAQTLLGAPIVNYSYNYSTSSLYNFSSPINITLLEYLVPQLTGNATNGWVTDAFGSGTNNASMQYIVIQTGNQSSIATALADLQANTFQSLPSITTGYTDGMNYTYESYDNSTGTFQTVVGAKDGYVSMIDIFANTFTTNQTQMAQVLAGNIQ